MSEKDEIEDRKDEVYKIIIENDWKFFTSKRISNNTDLSRAQILHALLTLRDENKVEKFNSRTWKICED